MNMNKLAVCSVLFAACASGADAAPKYLTRTADGGYNVSYEYRDKPKNNWYGTIRAELNLVSWTNEYFGDGTSIDSEKYSNRQLFGGGLAVGKKFNNDCRAEIELGYTGTFTNKDEGFDFSLSAPYALVNGMYDFVNGVYLGAGLGLAFPTTTMDDMGFAPGGRSKTSVSPMGGLMAGYSHKLDDNFTLDLRYRLAGFSGARHSRIDGEGGNFEMRTGIVLENSLSLGLRYEF